MQNGENVESLFLVIRRDFKLKKVKEIIFCNFYLKNSFVC